MSIIPHRSLWRLRPSPLAACLAGSLALAAPCAWAVTPLLAGAPASPGFAAGSPFVPLFPPPWYSEQQAASAPQVADFGRIPSPATLDTVTNCADAGPGSLRATVMSASSGDIINMTGLPCSIISLQTGAITITQYNLSLIGPGVDKLYISGNYYNTYEQDRIINDTVNGNLLISNLGIADGRPYSATGKVSGGCIYSAGEVELQNVVVRGCIAKTASPTYVARGGGIFAQTNLTASYSVIADNQALTVNNMGGRGGGASSTYLNCFYCSIYGNQATGLGGGLQIYQNARIAHSTISGNYSAFAAGGIAIGSGTTSAATTLDTVTISGNKSKLLVGGIYTTGLTTGLYNTTIAANTVVSNTAQPQRGVGLEIRGVARAVTATLKSTLIANNTYGSGTENDFSAYGFGTGGTATVSGDHNLIRTSFSTVPGGTLSACPNLGPLRDNGGPSQTMALLSRSPAIDKGSNPLNESFDQRGPKTVNGIRNFVRVSGSAADIGAYEMQQDDIIFDNGFDGCP